MRVEREAFDRMKRHCEDEYPHEGCGVLAGREDTVSLSLPVENSAKDRGFDVYVMDAEGQFAAFEEIEDEGLERLGFFHSHPDHDAYFSERDSDEATADGEPLYPGEAYVVLSVRDGVFDGAKAYRWGGDGFEEEGLEVV